MSSCIPDLVSILPAESYDRPLQGFLYQYNLYLFLVLAKNYDFYESLIISFLCYHIMNLNIIYKLNNPTFFFQLRPIL